MKKKSRKLRSPISIVRREYPFEDEVGPDVYADPLFADKELRDLCHLHPVEALEGELKTRVWANTEMIIMGISHKTWMLTEEYLNPHPGTNDNVYYCREYSTPIILRNLFEYLYPDFIKCSLAQFVRLFSFDGNPLVPLVWYGRHKDLYYFIYSLEKRFDIVPNKIEEFIRFDSRGQSKMNMWWKPMMYKSIIEMKSKSTTMQKSPLSDLADKMREWEEARSRGKIELNILKYRYSPPTVQFTTFRLPIWVGSIPRTVIYAREKYLHEDILDATKERSKLLDKIFQEEITRPIPGKE